MTKNKSKKSSEQKEDLKAVALFHFVVEHNKKYNLYGDELISYLSKGKSKKVKDEIEDTVWNSIIELEDYETFNESIKQDIKNGK